MQNAENDCMANNGKYNVMWGKEYLLMDSVTLGGMDGEKYDRIIDLLIKTREAEG
jgi:hypothetical protein